MLRLKISRRSSQRQRENREKMLNLRRHLEKVTEDDIFSVNASVSMINTSNSHEKTLNGKALAKSKNRKYI